MGEGGNIDTLFSDEAISAVSTYDRSRELAGENPWLRSSKDLETGMFSGDITAIEPGKAYFVNSTASVTVKVKLQAAGQLPPTIPVRQGFNAIGFWSVSGDARLRLTCTWEHRLECGLQLRPDPREGLGGHPQG